MRNLAILWKTLVLSAGFLLLTAASSSTAPYLTTARAATVASTLAVVGNHLVDNGQTITLRGVNRSGAEYACFQNFGFFDGPSDDASIAAMAAWGINAVRVPFNEDCWLGINGIPAAYSGANYQNAITGFVSRLRSHGLYVILDNQFAAPGTTQATTILPMADADHAPAFWTSVATAFASDRGVIFDLYNEPHDISWACWANGCQVTGGTNFVTAYQAAGMSSLVSAVRATGAKNVILMQGLSWGYDLSGWLANKPADGQLMAGIHNYGYSGWNTPAIWDNIYAPTAQQVPVTFGEMGFDGYVETIMPWADAHGVGYLAWTWDTWGNNEALISNYNGTPTTYGLGFKNYLATLAPPAPTVASVSPGSGPAAGGTSVAITGANFTGASAVAFGTTTAAGFVVNSATSITATSPAGSGTVDVRVTTPSGTSAVNALDRFTYGPTAPPGVQAVAGDTEATVTWAPPSAGAPITGYTVTASPGGATTTVSSLVPAATVTGLTNGTAYTFTVAATNVAGTGPASAASNSVTPTAVAQNALVAVLPAMSNNAYGGYLTSAYVENLGATVAHIRMQYFGTSGSGVGFGNSVAGLAPGATWTSRTDNGDALGTGQAGSALVYSDQPIAVFVNEFAPGGADGTSYTGLAPSGGTGSTVFAPTITNKAYGGYTTGIGLVNLAATTVTLTVTYRDSGGAATKIQTFSAAAGAYTGLYSGDATLALPSGFAGTATITSSGGNLAAVVNETGPGGQFSSYDAVPAGSTTVFAPAALRNAYGGYNTGTAIQNTTGTAGTVTIAYYNSSGALAATTTKTIAANGYLGIYQGSDVPADGAYTAKITSDVAVAAIVNEVAPSSNPQVQQSTSYNTFAAGSASLHLPLVESAGADGWSTGEGIMNTGLTPTTVTVTYFDAATGLAVGTPQTLVLPPNAFWGVYQPAGGLANGVRANATITAPAGQVAVICNESTATSFMSYAAQ